MEEIANLTCANYRIISCNEDMFIMIGWSSCHFMDKTGFRVTFESMTEEHKDKVKETTMEQIIVVEDYKFDKLYVDWCNK